MSILYDYYKKEVVPRLKLELHCANSLAVPRVMRVAVNAGVGKLFQNSEGEKRKQAMKEIPEDLARITGQYPAVRGARRSIADFKLREGAPSGFVVTMRGKRMWDFLERFIKLAIPRMRDFRGIDPRSIDEHGNLSLGIREQFIFPEIPTDEVRTPFGFEVTVVTSARSKAGGEALFRALGFPLKHIN